jgi:Kef-type K+ transport system membrane component KefB
VDLVVMALVAALAPLVVAVLPGPRIPQVVIFLLGGILIGPHVLGLAETSNIQLLANIGLGFLFLLAGYELDPALLRQQPGKLAIAGWLISAVLAVGAAAGLTAAGYIRDYVPVGLALTTTALGTLLPILRDNDMLTGRFGQHVYAAGASGELFPILIIAVFLTQRGHFIALASVALIGVLAIVLSAAPWLAESSTLQRVIREGQRDRADHAALGRGAAVPAARHRQPVRPGRRPRRLAGRDRAAGLDPPVQHGHRSA